MINRKIAIDRLMYRLEDVELNLAPIDIKIQPTDNKKRVSIFLLEINFEYFFGGYIGMLNFAKLFYQSGYRVRIITTNNNKTNLELWKQRIKKYKGLEDIFDIFEIENIYNRKKKYIFFEDEELIATSWWTANIAEQIRQQLGTPDFIYFIQDFEPIFYPRGTSYALALESYTFPHFAVFSTKILKDFFREKKLGVFKNNQELNAIFFRNAITKLEPSEKMNNRKVRKLLIYFRPEDHAARNMFELGYLALKQAISENIFNPFNWEFYGIGSLLPPTSEIPLSSDHSLIIIPKLSLEDYKKRLPGFDVGLSLMLSPHPSLVPIEMCSAGMNVVTNSFENKTNEEMKKISDNFYVAKPTVKSIKDALFEAVQDINNFEKRFLGANVSWPSNWDDTFNDDFKQKLFNRR